MAIDRPLLGAAIDSDSFTSEPRGPPPVSGCMIVIGHHLAPGDGDWEVRWSTSADGWSRQASTKLMSEGPLLVSHSDPPAQ